MFESGEGSNICDKEIRKIGSLVFIFFLQQIEDRTLACAGVVGRWEGGHGERGQLPDLLAQINLLCCSFRNLC